MAADELPFHAAAPTGVAPSDVMPDEMRSEREQLATDHLAAMTGAPAEALADVATESTDSYSQILKSSSIIGSAQAINLLIGMGRTKGVAMLLGPTGLGQVGLLLSTTQLVAQFAGLGINTSAVREVAEANASGDALRRSRTIGVLRRLVWITGAAGWAAMALLSPWISRWSFGDDEHATMLSILGVTVFIGSIGAGQAALIQGTRRIGDVARQSIIGAVLSTLVSLTCYAAWGAEGIVPALVMVSLCSALAAWWFAKRIPFEPVALSWRQTWKIGRQFITLGLAFMYSGAVVLMTSWAIQALVTQQFGSASNGIYGAAWAMSAQFAAFILTAMGADYFPRLTGAAQNYPALNRLVNEQSEVGVLLALPGLVATLAAAPWAVTILYSAEFLPAANLLPWFVLGIFGRVVSWPLGFIQLALGQGKIFALLETVFGALQVCLAVALGRSLGLEGVAVAFAVSYGVYVAVIRVVAGRVTGFRWSASVRKLLVQSAALVGGSFALQLALPIGWSMAVVGAIALATGVFCLRSLTARLGPRHRVTRWAARMPWLVPRSNAVRQL